MGEFSQLYLNLKVVRVESEIISFTPSERLPCWSRTCWLGVEIIADNVELTARGLQGSQLPSLNLQHRVTNLEFPLAVVFVRVVLGVPGGRQVQTVALFKSVLRTEDITQRLIGKYFPSLDIVLCVLQASWRR